MVALSSAVHSPKWRGRGDKLNAVGKISGTKPEEAAAPSYPALKARSVWIVIKSHKVQLNPGKEDGGVSRKDTIRGGRR